MTKRDLVIRISNETGLVQQQVLDVIQKTLDYISAALAQGKKVELRNFGVFEVKVRKARVGRNPNAPETDVPIPQRAVVKFKPGKEMRETVIQLTPEQVEAAAKAGGCGLLTVELDRRSGDGWSSIESPRNDDAMAFRSRATNPTDQTR